MSVTCVTPKKSANPRRALRFPLRYSLVARKLCRAEDDFRCDEIKDSQSNPSFWLVYFAVNPRQQKEQESHSAKMAKSKNHTA